ncbi:MAG: hypothetical protein H6766_07015 [Candidatus Peribacteria bacterium]|nr:MAG: hypothetical protein H6766_07015 [Candidatus Peribacteria bacterium]
MVTIDTPTDILSPEETTTFDITLADQRGNTIDDDTPIRVALRGPLTTSGSQSSLVVPVDKFPITLTAGDR